MIKVVVIKHNGTQFVEDHSDASDWFTRDDGDLLIRDGNGETIAQYRNWDSVHRVSRVKK